MLSVGLFPALALIAGTLTALIVDDLQGRWVFWLTLACAGIAMPAWYVDARKLATISLAVGFWASAALLTTDARERALDTSLRATLDREFGGFAIATMGPERPHPPMRVRAVLIEDATPRDGYISLRARAIAVRIRDVWQSDDGGLIVSVSGDSASDRAMEWRGGRIIEAPMTFRRPARYLNDGVPDFERELALDGTTLLASVKSGLVVEVVRQGSALDELASAARARVRAAIGRWVLPRDPVSSAIATAILIGDRGGLPDETRDQLQAAGTYHVIAISGGNIAILAALITGLLAISGLRGRGAALPAMLMLGVYALIASSGPSVWRATLMALVYFGARAIDHRAPVWHAAAVAAALMVVSRPLDLRDPGFVLTYGATAALLEGARRGVALLPQRRVLSWVVASVVSSLAVEAALLPVSAQMFSRVTSAGLILNLIAIPLTGVIQVAALTTVMFDSVASIASPAGWMAHLSASALVGSAQLVTVAPWLAARVPAPGIAMCVAYYVSVALLLAVRRFRVVSGGAVLVLAVMIASGIRAADLVPRKSTDGVLRLTVFDVGQGESMLLETPSHQSILIDAGGAPFGGSVDIGQRVLAPALWTRGLRSLDTLLVTHGDPDHIGGAPAMVDDFDPRDVWEGIRVPVHLPSLALAERIEQHGSHLTSLRVGHEFTLGAVRVRVLSPPEPDWERRRVRNDDSVVLEVLYGDIAMLLTGDIGADVERMLIPSLTPARVRILKVAHHGSRTSTSQELLDAWPPDVALISCGRGNRFGHPAPEVMSRLEATKANILRTDRDGQITIETDGHAVKAHRYVGEAR